MTVEGRVVGLFAAWLRAGLAVNVCLLPLADTPEGHHGPAGSRGAQCLEKECLHAPYAPGISVSLMWVPFVPAQLSGTGLPTVGQHPALEQPNLAQSTEGS